MNLKLQDGEWILVNRNIKNWIRNCKEKTSKVDKKYDNKHLYIKCEYEITEIGRKRIYKNSERKRNRKLHLGVVSIKKSLYKEKEKNICKFDYNASWHSAVQMCNQSKSPPFFYNPIVYIRYVGWVCVWKDLTNVWSL